MNITELQAENTALKTKIVHLENQLKGSPVVRTGIPKHNIKVGEEYWLDNDSGQKVLVKKIENDFARIWIERPLRCYAYVSFDRLYPIPVNNNE